MLCMLEKAKSVRIVHSSSEEQREGIQGLQYN